MTRNVSYVSKSVTFKYVTYVVALSLLNKMINKKLSGIGPNVLAIQNTVNLTCREHRWQLLYKTSTFPTKYRFPSQFTDTKNSDSQGTNNQTNNLSMMAEKLCYSMVSAVLQVGE